MMRVTKIDAARRQLITAIRVFFDGGDFVSVYSLATNAWEVIAVLCKEAGVNSFTSQVEQNVAPGKDLKRHYINEPCRNFFKHADRDPNPDSAVELGEANVASILFLAVEDYIRLKSGGPIEAQVFQLWYIAIFPEKLLDGMEAVLEKAEDVFPNIGNLDMHEQIAMGRHVLEDARRDVAVMNDPQTEPSL